MHIVLLVHRRSSSAIKIERDAGTQAAGTSFQTGYYICSAPVHYQFPRIHTMKKKHCLAFLCVAFYISIQPGNRSPGPGSITSKTCIFFTGATTHPVHFVSEKSSARALYCSLLLYKTEDSNPNPELSYSHLLPPYFTNVMSNVSSSFPLYMYRCAVAALKFT